jgi:uncharacterized protein (TIGR02453 family)
MPSFYSTDTLKFFRGIKRNPRKDWYEKNKALYKESYSEASGRLIEVLSRSPEFQAIGLKGTAKQGVFRLHRDLRFSHDKSPYKSHNGFIMSRSGSKKDAGVFYMHFEPGASSLWMGYWLPEPQLLTRFREWIVAHPDKYLDSVERKLSARKLKFSSDDDLKRLPQAFRGVEDSRIHPALQRRSHLVFENLSDEETLDGARLLRRVRSFAKRSAPLILWGAALEEGV